jgi:hypothetical protein
MFILNTHKMSLFTGYFTSDNKPDGIENAIHNTFPMKTWILKLKYQAFLWKCILGCIFNSFGLITLVSSSNGGSKGASLMKYLIFADYWNTYMKSFIHLV